MFCLTTGYEVQARTWTNDSGATVSGTLIGAREKEVDLKMDDGSLVTFPRSILSGEDEQYVANWAMEKGFEAAGNGPYNTPIGKDGVVSFSKQAGNWEKPWPQFVTIHPIPVTIQQENDTLCLYQTDNFTFESGRPLLREELTALASEMQSCFTTLAQIPLNLNLASQPRRKYTVRIHFDKNEYIKAGGIAGQRFTAQPTYILVLLQRSSKNRPVDLRKLDAMHELTHWVTQFVGNNFWLNEGLARYMELVIRERGKLRFDNDLNRVALSIPRIYRRGWEPLPPLREVLNGSETDESERMGLASLAVATYFFRFDGAGDAARIKAYTKAVQDGEKDTSKLEAILLDGRTWEELENDIRKSWKNYMTPKFEKGQ